MQWRNVQGKSRCDDLHDVDCMSRLTSDGVAVRKVVSDSPSCILSAFIGGVRPPSASVYQKLFSLKTRDVL